MFFSPFFPEQSWKRNEHTSFRMKALVLEGHGLTLIVFFQIDRYPFLTLICVPTLAVCSVVLFYWIVCKLFVNSVKPDYSNLCQIIKPSTVARGNHQSPAALAEEIPLKLFGDGWSVTGRTTPAHAPLTIFQVSHFLSKQQSDLSDNFW